MPDVPLGGPNLASFGVLGPQEQAEAPVSGLDALIRGALKIGMIPGQVMQSQQPVTTQDLIKPAADMAMMTTLGAGAAPAEENALRMGIKAYHGSPHDFDHFDMGKIGTGEGKQAYGHGLYFAEAEPTALSYRNALAPQVAGETLGWRTHEFSPQARQAINAHNGDIDEAIAHYQTGASRGERGAKFYGPVAQELEQIKALGRQPVGGHMYEVDINADPAHFLDWDKRWSEQPEAVQKMLRASGIHPESPGPMGTKTLNDNTLGDLAGVRFKEPNSLVNRKAREAGIPGIKYLDQGSRGAGEGSHNYVVFDDSLINILRKYGLAGAIPTGAISSGLFDQNNQ